MRARLIGVAAWVGAVGAILAPLPAVAISYSGYIGTTVYGYEYVPPDPNEPSEIIADTYVPIRFSVAEEIGGGDLGFVASSRLYKDVGGEGDLDGRIYYGYVRYKLPGEWLEANVGRQYIAAGVTAATLDGARVRVKGGRKWLADVYGGITVTPDYGPMRRFSQLDDKSKIHAPFDRGYWLDYYTYGAHGGVNVDKLWERMPFPVWVGVGGSLSKRRGHISDTVFGFDFAEDLLKNLKATQEIHYDYIGRRYDYQYYSFRYRPVTALRTYVDYRWSEPRFDYTSVFSVFAREGRHRVRGGGRYKFSEILQPFADYSLGMRSDNLSHRAQAGLEQNFEFVYLRYGGLYGMGSRGDSGGEEFGGFAAAEFPQPIPAFDRLSAGASVDYLRYSGYATPAPAKEDVALVDLHGRLKVWRSVETTLGVESLFNPDRDYEVRAYLQANASISR